MKCIIVLFAEIPDSTFNNAPALCSNFIDILPFAVITSLTQIAIIFVNRDRVFCLEDITNDK